jgi:TonB family protein
LIRQNPKQFTEAPGPKVDQPPISAPYSDANRRATMPHPTGDTPTPRPGEGGFYTPPAAHGDGRPPQNSAVAHNVQQELMQQPQQASPQTSASAPQPGTNVSSMKPLQASNGAVDLRSAIREVGKIASLGTGQQGLDMGNGGGEKGFAADGPLSFETQWYDWGPYAASMVSRIRVNWEDEMPRPLLQSGMKGVVTIRFTIHRDGHISDVTILSTSGIPPYDFAAKKAIERSSPLNPLPKDFPNETERVTAMFFYNQEPPK